MLTKRMKQTLDKAGKLYSPTRIRQKLREACYGTMVTSTKAIASRERSCVTCEHWTKGLRLNDCPAFCWDCANKKDKPFFKPKLRAVK